jgi:cytosine/adenosine deaminase-related metal-dependent hydrolase
LNAWDPAAGARYRRVLDYLARLATAPRALVVHGNYLSDEEVFFLAQHAATMSVIYCPRTHDFFRHAPYPLARMLSQGVAVAVGTDSRASNPDLGLFEELKFIASHHSAIAPDRILELGTFSGARALGLDGEMGTLEAGKRADLAVIRLSPAAADDPHERLFSSDARVMETWLAGRRAAVN